MMSKSMSLILFLVVLLSSSTITVQAAGGKKGKGKGKGKGEGGRKGLKGYYGDVEKVDNECSVLPEDPVCPYNKAGDAGIWVCRTTVDKETGLDSGSFSICSSPEYRLETDTCGCCPEDDSCPMPCTCPCELDGVADAGVLVLKEKSPKRSDADADADADDEDEDDTTPIEVCKAPEAACRMVATSPYTTCAVC